MESQDNERNAYGEAKASRIRLKSKSERRSKRHREEREGDLYQSSRRHHFHRHNDSRRSHRESKRRKKHGESSSVYEHTFARTGEYDNPDHRQRESLYDDLGEGLDQKEPTINDEQAFRESLFDALADDEGAAYWEGVYGQPVHVYPNTKAGPDGKLERMSEEEYAEYVRTKMWEKSHQHVLEEREARERSRKQDKERRHQLEEETARQEAERDHVRERMQESLRRGEERKKAKEAEAAWNLYLKKWESLQKHTTLTQEKDIGARELIPWPVVSGKWKHVSKDDIEYFFEHSNPWKDDTTALLKFERVRWHPDKMQHRFGQHIDHETMKLVTAVFQVVDRLWNDRRG
ncbi:hypothetical protein K491DRAFT_33476 [Lophiostoma macrostomum CBS 122681]|uniref:Uncharacterized protein n=1 Tax=Lophiostoma macrostomum CBS 122681 TaxID=1314788 RepID=A0A6A6T072_9PLEO|nr:hypothetical protein K491DRAFT_33476 [Lophiostoma macrostomum CBS 122681]